MYEAAAHSVINGQLVGVARGDTIEPVLEVARQPAQPSKAKVHELGILDVTEIRWVREHGIKASRSQFDIGRAYTAQPNLTRSDTISFFADPLVRNMDLDLASALMLYLEGGFAKRFAFAYLSMMLVQPP